MENSHVNSTLFGHAAGVRAWALVSNHNRGANQSAWNDANFLDGYNLYLDLASRNVGTAVGVDNGKFDGALKFTFVTPMPDNKYKVFVSSGPGKDAALAHVLDSAAYPKTKDSFYVRVGTWHNTGLNTNIPAAASRSHNQITTTILWASASSSLGLVVFR